MSKTAYTINSISTTWCNNEDTHLQAELLRPNDFSGTRKKDQFNTTKKNPCEIVYVPFSCVKELYTLMNVFNSLEANFGLKKKKKVQQVKKPPVSPHYKIMALQNLLPK